MKLTMLGTGNALAIKTYNTCFLLSENNEHILVDGGGGNGIFHQLNKVHISLDHIHHVIMTHKHTDHFFGVIWILRAISMHMNQGLYEGDAYFYGHQELIDLLDQMCKEFLPRGIIKNIGKRIHLVIVSDGEILTINHHEFTFFDIHSTKAKQYGFRLTLEDGYLTCLGDEPYDESERPYVIYAKWLLCEAFCLKSEAEHFHPYEKHHSTVADASKLASQMHVKHLVLYHTEDTAQERKALYLNEGKAFYHGDLHLPCDLEVIDL